MTAQHTPVGDDSFRASLLRSLAGGAGLVVLLAAVFWAIGSFAGPDAPLVAGGDRDPEEELTAVEEDPAPEQDEQPDGDATPEQDEEPDPEPTEDDEPGESEPEPAEDDESADEAAEAAAIPRGEITVQILDGVGTDGGAAAERVAGELRETGYDIVAQNPALAYEVTTVLWTTGNEDRARQVAADIGASQVREQPGNLSEAVDVHVVVGADRA